MAAKSSSLPHVSFFRSRWWEQSRPEPYLFLSTSIFAGQNDQLRLKSSKTVLKAFQLIFPWLKMKWKTVYISNLDSWVNQKKHLSKDARRKKCYEVEMCDDQLRFFLFLVLLSRHLKKKKVEFSHPVQYSTSPKYPCFPELLYSTYIVCMAVGKNVVLAPARM